MTTNLLVYAELNSNPQGKTLRSDAPESKRFFHCIQKPLRTKFKLGHELRENNLTKCDTSLLSSARKKKKKMQFLRHNKTLNYFKMESYIAII